MECARGLLEFSDQPLEHIETNMDVFKRLTEINSPQRIDPDMFTDFYVRWNGPFFKFFGLQLFRRERILSIEKLLMSMSPERASRVVARFLDKHIWSNSSFKSLKSAYSDLEKRCHDWFHAVAVSAVVLLCFVYQYLLGYEFDRGGSKIYSSGSLDFRETYISIVLFRGSYDWIKFRDVAPKGVYCRSTEDKQGRITYKYEPRFKPPREKVVGSSKSLIHNWIYLGQFDTRYEAEVMYQIAAFWYGKDEDRLDLGDGSFFTIPSMTREDQSLCGTAKVEWVKVQAKRVYEDFKKEKAAINLPPTSREPEWTEDDHSLVQEMLAACEAEMRQEDAQEHMEGCGSDQGNQFNLTTSQFQQPNFLANQTLNAGMNIAMQGQFSQLALNADNGFNSNTSNQEALLQMLLNNQQQLINLQQQQLQESKLQNSEMQQQILELQQQQRLQQQELQESKLQNLQLQHQILELQQRQHLQLQVQEFNVQSLMLPHESHGGERMIPQNHTNWPQSSSSEAYWFSRLV